MKIYISGPRQYNGNNMNSVSTNQSAVGCKSLAYKYAANILIVIICLINSPKALAIEMIVSSSWSYSDNLFNEMADDFSRKYNKKTGQQVRVLSKINGAISQVDLLRTKLKANIVSTESPEIMDEIVKETLKISADWRTVFANGSCPYSSPLIFVVRRGNPKNLKNWSDMSRKGLELMFADPVLSGVGRYVFLAALADAGRRLKSKEDTDSYMGSIFTAVRLNRCSSPYIHLTTI